MDTVAQSTIAHWPMLAWLGALVALEAVALVIAIGIALRARVTLRTLGCWTGVR